ncbi:MULTISPECIES: hypothetical protein [Bacillus]|uniref:hypothetical protein n=1 Tax=Bacillus TaxID=1386 RepID=UPI00065C12F2|nr:hypothetical protein [Bacillus wiedmannii]KMP92770.1 hypothetical protein TU65_19265 [Bacillus wiedmannii]MCU5517442.1 hypothetical protein [Bacillus wiedmannii]PEJ71731.1 hypothetical protein CN888_19490 [Bacillus wiedmannii]PEN04004.1 hypothetical protein CN621_01310 [Bacillus wiedmannii]PEP49071.1 hypothetical protein CN557_26655 [Bacillus wiedmannii]
MKRFIKPLLIASAFALGITTIAPEKGFAEVSNYENKIESTYELEYNNDVSFENNFEVKDYSELEQSNLQGTEGLPEHGVQYALPLIPVAIAAIMRLVPVALKAGSRHINMSKFTQRVSGQLFKDPKSGWSISKERSGNPHGGSAWKLISPKGKKEATLDSKGKVLR